MTGAPTTSVRLWRLGPWSRNPLVRPCDRFESVLVLFVVVVVLLMVPFAAAYGTATFTRLDAQARADRAASQQIPAVLMEDSLPGAAAVANQSHHTIFHAQAQWSVQNMAHTGDVPAPTGARAGETVSVWIDENGELVSAPASSTEIAATAVSTAIVAWVVGAIGGGVALCGAHVAITRHRLAHWDAEGNELGKPPGWAMS